MNNLFYKIFSFGFHDPEISAIDCKKSSDFFVLFAMFFIYVQFRCQKINIDV